MVLEKQHCSNEILRLGGGGGGGGWGTYSRLNAYSKKYGMWVSYSFD